MRRTTLGTLNIGNQSRPVTREKKSSLGPRPSIGNRASVGRPSTSGRTSTSGRPSLANARSATGRRPSSQYGHGVQTMMKDPRPLTDRGYQQKMIRYLMEFLTEFNYPYQISMRTLSAPSMKEFCNIFQFLYKYIKADTQKTTALDSKPAEEIPRIFKTLGYPFNISKSNLYSVGSPHAWPIVLGALCWLIELIRHAMSIGQDIEGHVLFPEDNYHPDDYQDEGPQPEEKCFFGYLEKSYEAFMMGKELDELGEYDAEFIDNIRSRNASLLEGMEELIKESVSLEEELNALKSDSSRLQTLAERKITLTSDSEKFQNYLGDLEKHRKQLDEKNDQLVEELQGLKVEQDTATQENAILQQTLNNQELSAGDVERMKHDKRELQKAIEQLEKERDYYDQQIWEKEMQYAKKHEETEKQIREYNEMTRKLKLIPSSAENANGIDFEMHFNPHAQGPDQRARMDFRGTIKPALLRLKQNISEKSRTIQSQVITEDEAFDQISEMVQDKQEEVTGLGMKLQTVDKDLNWKKEIMSKEYQKNNGTAQSLEEGVQQMRTKVLAREEAIGIKENKLQELNLRVEKSGVERQEEKEEYSDFILKACRMIMEHKTLIQDRTHKINEQAEEIAEETKQAEVPKSSIAIPEQMEEEQS